LAGSIIESIKNNHSQVLKAVGAGAINVAVKAIADVSQKLTRGPLGISGVYAELQWFDAEGQDGQTISGISIRPVYVKQIDESAVTVAK
jgi:hypothetical protein